MSNLLNMMKNWPFIGGPVSGLRNVYNMFYNVCNNALGKLTGNMCLKGLASGLMTFACVANSCISYINRIL